MQELITLLKDNAVTVIAIPLIAALIGWITNYIAVKMIFRPRKPVNLLFFKIQGLVPKRQKEIALSIAETIEKNLISHEDVKNVIQGKDIEEEVSNTISTQIDLFIEKTISANPMIGMFLQGTLLEQIKVTLVEQMKSVTPEFLGKVMGKVETNLDFKKVIREKIESFDLSRLESIIYSISSRELKMIELLGGVLGFIVGIVQVGIMLGQK